MRNLQLDDNRYRLHSLNVACKNKKKNFWLQLFAPGSCQSTLRHFTIDCGIENAYSKTLIRRYDTRYAENELFESLEKITIINLTVT